MPGVRAITADREYYINTPEGRRETITRLLNAYTTTAISYILFFYHAENYECSGITFIAEDFFTTIDHELNDTTFFDLSQSSWMLSARVKESENVTWINAEGWFLFNIREDTLVPVSSMYIEEIRTVQRMAEEERRMNETVI